MLAFLSAAISAVQPRELRFAIANDPRSFDPLHAYDSGSETVRYLTSGVLVRINRVTNQLQPELAESWSATDSGRVLTFHLRAGLKFSDGSPLDASAVARILNRALDPAAPSPVGDALRSAEGNPQIRAASPLDVTLRYRSAKPGLELMFDDIGIAAPDPAKPLPASAGPFFVSEYHRGDFLRLQRNPHYWKRDASGHQLPLLDSIRIDIQRNHDIELNRFLRGEIHLIDRLDSDSFNRLKKQKPAEAHNLGASLDCEFLWFNQSPAPGLPPWKRKWFASAAFRHAVSRSIRRDDIIRLVYGGNAHSAAGPISTANRLWFNTELKPLAADQPAALKLLTTDGFTLQNGVLRDNAAHPVEFSLITNTGNRAREQMAQLIRSDLAKIGIRVILVPLEQNSLLERIGKTFDYEATILGFSNVATDPREEQNVWLSSSPMHAWRPSQKSPATAWEARIDELEMKQASERSYEVRKRLIDEFQRIVVNEEPLIYLVNPDYLCAIASAVKGAQPVVTPPQIFWNVEWLSLQ